jgi:type II secretory pathway predicted ATPase ExeA
MQPKDYKGWQDLPTRQSKEILNDLNSAKEEPMALMLIADTGLGKTKTIQLFKKTKPRNTFVVTVGDTFNLLTTLHGIMLQMGLRPIHGNSAKHVCINRISEKLEEIVSNGGDVPVIIIDEAENSKLNMLKAYKQLYDFVIDKCSLVLIGTDQLIHQINKQSVSMSIPQLKRRFKAGTRKISPLNKARDFKPFFDLYIKDNTAVQDMLLELCENYGELHDYLDPVLRFCAKRNLQLTEQIFRLHHKLPEQTIIKSFKRA